MTALRARGYLSATRNGASAVGGSRASNIRSLIAQAANDLSGTVRSPANANPRLGANVRPVVRTLGRKAVVGIAQTAETSLTVGRVGLAARAVTRALPYVRALEAAYILYEVAEGQMKAKQVVTPAGYDMTGWTVVSECVQGERGLILVFGNSWPACNRNYSIGSPSWGSSLPFTNVNGHSVAYEWRFNRVITSGVSATGLRKWQRTTATAPTPQYQPATSRAEALPGAVPAPIPAIPYRLLPYVLPSPLSQSYSPSTATASPRQPRDRPSRDPSSGHRYKRPGPREREGKGTVRGGAVTTVLRLVNGVSEGNDAIDWIYQGLHPILRAQLEKNGPLTPFEKAEAVYKHFNTWWSIDRAVKAGVANMLEDRFYGYLGGKVAGANKTLFDSGDVRRGAETGPSDTVVNDAIGEEMSKLQDKPLALDFEAQVEYAYEAVRKVVQVISKG